MGHSGFHKPNDIWVPLVEKAWAKMCGTYDHSTHGTAPEALRALTGAPVRYYSHPRDGSDNTAQLFKVIKEAL